MQGQAGADVHIGNRPKTGGWWLSATRRAGWFHNYIGHLLLWSGIDFPEEPAFLDDAIKELREAVKRLPTYYQPWENLGDSYRFRVRVIADVPRRRELLMHAEDSYQHAQRNAALLPRRFMASTELRLAVSQATARLLTGHPSGLQRSLVAIASIDSDEEPLRILELGDRATIYNLASFYALLDRAQGSGSPSSYPDNSELAPWVPRLRALQYLAYALIAWPSTRQMAATDPDLVDLPGRQEVMRHVEEANPVTDVAEDLSRSTRQRWWVEATWVALREREAASDES